MKRLFYVTCRDAGRTGWLAGPYAMHDEALALVDTVREKAIDADPWAHFGKFEKETHVARIGRERGGQGELGI